MIRSDSRYSSGLVHGYDPSSASVRGSRKDEEEDDEDDDEDDVDEDDDDDGFVSPYRSSH
ncbi:hypothetical protein MMC31_005155, partial [Peltigera leucophlebia]|nr:hypothetical protein [Peltigera leucophlebia]